MALTKDRVTLRKELGLKSYLMAATTKIYGGSLVAINTSGYAVPASDTAGLVVVGVADAQYDNPGLDGAMSCKVYTHCMVLLAATSVTQAMVERPMFVVDDQTVDETQGTNRVFAGILKEVVSSTSGYVEISGGGSGSQLAGAYTIVAGQSTTVAASDTIVTGLSLLVGVVATLDSDPVDDPFMVTASIGDQAGTPAAGSFLLKTWKNTGGTDPTPAAATTFSKKVNWWAFGI